MVWGSILLIEGILTFIALSDKYLPHFHTDIAISTGAHVGFNHILPYQ